MVTVYVKDNIVREIIKLTPVEQYYGEKFATECMSAPNTTKVGYVYKDGKFSPPVVPQPEAEEPSDFDRLEAQILYTALMTDTLLEG